MFIARRRPLLKRGVHDRAERRGKRGNQGLPRYQLHPADTPSPLRTWTSQVGAASPSALGASGERRLPLRWCWFYIESPAHAQGRAVSL
jgi:hypothetical protein